MEFLPVSGSSSNLRSTSFFSHITNASRRSYTRQWTLWNKHGWNIETGYLRTASAGMRTLNTGEVLNEMLMWHQSQHWSCQPHHTDRCLQQGWFSVQLLLLWALQRLKTLDSRADSVVFWGWNKGIMLLLDYTERGQLYLFFFNSSSAEHSHHRNATRDILSIQGQRSSFKKFISH